MKIPDFVAKWCYRTVMRWVFQDADGSFAFRDDAGSLKVEKDDVARDLIEVHNLLSRIPDTMLNAMHRVVHASATGTTMGLLGEKDRDKFLFVSGEISGMRKAINGIEKIAKMDVTPLVKRIKKRRETINV